MNRSDSQGTETNSHAFVREHTGALLRRDHIRTFATLSSITVLTHNLKIAKTVATAPTLRDNVVLSHQRKRVLADRVQIQVWALALMRLQDPDHAPPMTLHANRALTE